MATVTSNDGSTISYTQAGSGEPLILVDGALCSREMGPMEDLSEHLAEHFTVIRYDRRGRGESTDASPRDDYEHEREVQDIAALIDSVGGTARLAGVSSGGALSLLAANALETVSAVAVYEVPFITDAEDAAPADFFTRMREIVARDERSEAVRFFLGVVGMPTAMIHAMRVTPIWRKLKRVAHTLPYDAAMVRDAVETGVLRAHRWSEIDVPVAVLDGGKSPQSMRRANADLAEALRGSYRTLPGQTHMVKGKALGPALVDAFAAVPATA